MKPATESTTQTLTFLAGGGEMGELTRRFNWQQTPLGAPGHWPQSLRATVGIMLHSAFPIFLFWGEELTCFYNDAFRPSLGIDGKHPALGKAGKEVWAEIWDFIGPLIEKVMATGEAVWFDDQLVPFYRNGRMEDIYWTFSYSPAYGDDGRVSGVFVICNETTGKVKSLQKNEQALKTIAESEERFRTMAEGSDILIAMADESSNATYFNTAWVQLTGRPMEELIKYGWADLVHPDDRQPYLNIYLDAFAKQTAFTGEFRLLNKKGDYTWLLAKGPPRFRADGSFAGHISSCIDITELKQAEKAYKESEHRMRTLVENAPFAIGVYMGREMRVVLANDTILNIWGKGNDVIGMLFKEVLPELDNQAVFEQLDIVFSTGVPFHARNQRLDLVVDGRLQPYYFNYSLTPLFDEEGKVYGVMNTGADITDLNAAQQKIAQSERNFRAMILQAPVAMCILMGPQHVIEVANEQMIELWGKTAAEVMYKPVFEALPDARRQGLEELMHSVYTTGETFKASERPVVLLRKGRFETVYQNFVYEPYRDGDSSILGILAISIDVTEQVIARQKIQEVVEERTKELAVANAGLQRSNAELAQFAYIASHDLQEPLRKVTSFTQMLERTLGVVDARSKNYIDKINSATTRMDTLIRDVLAYSQLSKETVLFSPVDLNQVIADILIDFELQVEQTGATIEYSGLPLIEAIPLQMSQLFGNLLSNSLKFTRPGVKAHITISAAVLDEAEVASQAALVPGMAYYSITLADNGIGFARQYAEQIFNIFQRLHGKTEYSGTGIGLAMCKKIVQNHHGEIIAASPDGGGAVFKVVLPVRQGV